MSVAEAVLADHQTVKFVEHATTQVFTTMLARTPNMGTWEKASDSHTVDGVVAVLSFSGPWSGSGAIHMSEKLACALVNTLMFSETQQIDDEILDGVGELANMILGSFKEACEAITGPLSLSTPTVITGEKLQTRVAGGAEWVSVPFVTDDETITVMVQLHQSDE